MAHMQRRPSFFSYSDTGSLPFSLSLSRMFPNSFLGLDTVQLNKQPPSMDLDQPSCPSAPHTNPASGSQAHHSIRGSVQLQDFRLIHRAASTDRVPDGFLHAGVWVCITIAPTSLSSQSATNLCCVESCLVRFFRILGKFFFLLDWFDSLDDLI